MKPTMSWKDEQPITVPRSATLHAGVAREHNHGLSIDTQVGGEERGTKEHKTGKDEEEIKANEKQGRSVYYEYYSCL